MIEQILEDLAEIRAQIDLLNIDKQKQIDSVITEEQRAAIRDIEFEFHEKVEAAQANATELESKVKPLVVEHGKSVKSSRLQAVYMSPKVTWDSKALDGYALNNPALYAFRKEGEASVQIRVVK
mgnify:FL=1